MGWTEIKHALNSSLGSDKFRPLNTLQLERTLVDRYSTESLIWAMTQYGIGAAFNQMYQLHSDVLQRCYTIDEIYNSDEALRACLNNSEVVELLYLYPYLDFKTKIRSTYTLSSCIPEGLINNIFFIGDVVNINLNGYGDVEFTMVDKNYDGEGTSCWMTVNTLFDYTGTCYQWHTWETNIKPTLIELSNKFTDTVIRESIQVVTRKYADIRTDDNSSNKSNQLVSRVWVPSGSQIRIDASLMDFEDKPLQYYYNHSKKRNKSYNYLRNSWYKSSGNYGYYQLYYVDPNGSIKSESERSDSSNKFTLGIPIAITIKG